MKFKLLLLILLPSVPLLAQSNDHHIIAPQGGHTDGKTMSLSWTIGDLATEAGILTTGSVTQGFQQPIITVMELEADKPVDPGPIDGKVEETAITMRNADFDAEVYPNPVGTDITVKVENSKEEYYLDLFDPSGNLISRYRSAGAQEVINLSDLPAAQYVLRISTIESQQSKVFRIIKTQ